MGIIATKTFNDTTQYLVQLDPNYMSSIKCLLLPKKSFPKTMQTKMNSSKLQSEKTVYIELIIKVPTKKSSLRLDKSIVPNAFSNA